MDILEKFFVEDIKKHNMADPLEILNWYRNLYYKEESGTERYIMAWAINDLFMKYKEQFLRGDKMETCNCYQNRGECWGTKERDRCSCGGDETKCDFYPEKRVAARTRKVIEDFKRKEIEHLESEIKTLEERIRILNGGSEYFNVFALDEDDFKALIELRQRKMKAIK